LHHVSDRDGFSFSPGIRDGRNFIGVNCRGVCAGGGVCAGSYRATTTPSRFCPALITRSLARCVLTLLGYSCIGLLAVFVLLRVADNGGIGCRTVTVRFTASASGATSSATLAAILTAVIAVAVEGRIATAFRGGIAL
jgi:hypothetical protein